MSGVRHSLVLFFYFRVFGHLEKPFFLELCKFMESVKVHGGDYLFKVGDEDNCIYVVQSGLVEVFIKEKVIFLQFMFQTNQMSCEAHTDMYYCLEQR